MIRMAALIVLVGVAAALAVLFLSAGVPVLAAGPEPTILPPIDPRSDGQGPGLVGSPLVIAVGVIFLGALTALVTALVLRLARES